jgi:hypothetical protein
MRRLLAAVLSSSLPLFSVGAAEAGPSRTLEYSVVATSGGTARRSTVTIDFRGGSAERLISVNVDETVDDNTQRHAFVGIEPSGALRADTLAQLTAETETICSLMSMESEDLAGVSTGDHWERSGRVPGGRHHTRYAVLGVDKQGFVEFSVARDSLHDDGTSARWRGTMHYDADAAVPSTIVLNGDLGEGGRSVAMSIRLVHDTFKHY